jgi:predicted nucleotidyltransferase
MSFIAPTIPLDVYGEANVRLGKVEAKENVTILMAVESGSRAWGFPSPDSDNDVRFFYVRPLSHYVGLEAPRDVVEQPIDGLWDVNGWDLGKALRLLVKGNATVAEWLSSPLIYREHGPFPYKLRDLIKRNASPAASARHYYGLTKTCFQSEIGSRPTAELVEEAAAAGATLKGITTVNLKKYLYALRGAACIAWIKRYDEVPPMTLPHLASHDILPSDTRDEMTKLLRLKATMGEFGHGVRIKALDNFIVEQMDWVIERRMDRLPIDPTFAAEANQLLLEALGIG